ncbi:hypothetical protein EI004_15915 [Escherichia coli]|nr:hypothetical protein [Escherichia coli]
MMSLWDALRMNMMISYQELVRTFPNLFANKVDVDHPENKYKDFKDLEDNVEKRLQNRQAKYQNEINQLSAPGVNFDDI